MLCKVVGVVTINNQKCYGYKHWMLYEIVGFVIVTDQIVTVTNT